jgi:hypothetical protein
MPLNMKLSSFAHSNVADVEGAEPSGRVVGCSRFSRQHALFMVIGPHHAAVTRHVGDSSEVGQREHMVQQGFTGKCWSEFLCLGGYLAPPRQVGGRSPRDAPGRYPSAGPRRWPPAGGPVAGAQLAQLGIELFDAKRLWHHAGYWLSISRSWA